MAVATATAVGLPSFTVEANHRRNQDILIQALPERTRLRTAIRPDRTTKNVKRDLYVVPKDQAIHLGGLPPVPGMQIHVNPRKLTYTITDPLHENEKICTQIEQHLKADGRPYGSKVGGVPPKEGTLDKDRMKCLVREIVHWVEQGHMNLVKGVLPDMDMVDAMDGEYLTNPGSRIPNAQPRYEKDMAEWVQRKSGIVN